MPRRWKQSSRRKQSSSAFEFTGEEALAAERAFEQRNPTSSRKPKISVTSISPLSTINKLLLTRTKEPSSNYAPNPPISKKIRNPAKATAVVKKPASEQKGTPDSTFPAQTREAVESPASVPSSPSTPSRRSLRKRLPSFKLRTSSHVLQDSPHQVPVRVRIRTPPSSSQHISSNDRIEALQESLSSDVPLGHPQNHQTKRPHETGPDVDDDANPAVPQIKKPRSDDDTRAGAGTSNNDPEDTRGICSEHCSATAERVTLAGGVTHPAGPENGIENQHRNESSVFPTKTPDQSNVDSVNEDATKMRSAVENHSEHTMAVDQKDCVAENKASKNMERPKAHLPTMDPETEKDKPTTDVAEKKPCTQGSGSAAENRLTDTKPSSEETRLEEATPRSDSKRSAQLECSAEESAAADACQATKFKTPASNSLLESPVTPLKPDAEVQVPDNPLGGLPTKHQPLDTGQDEEVTISKQGRNANSGSTPPANTESAPEKITTAPANANRTASERELQRDQEVVPEGSVTTPSERTPISAQIDAKENIVTTAAATITKEQKPESDQLTLGLVQTDEIKGPAGRKHGAHVDPNESMSSTLIKAERKSPTKPPSGAMKRVRFTEPTQHRSSEKKLGFSGIMKLRRRRVYRHRARDADFGDVSVLAAGTKGPDEKGRHLLLDELQYLLDGIFKTGTNGGKKGQTSDNQVVASSLQSLIKLLLRRSKTSGQPREEREEHNCGELVKILVEEPNLLKTIVKRLCAVLGKSRASDAFLALVFVIILRSTPKILLLTEHELDLLLNAFFRNSASSLKESEPDAQKRGDTKDTMEKEPQARRRGKLGRVFDQRKPKEDILTPLLKLMTDADVIEEDCSAFTRETEAASHLMGIAISLILRNELETREWMRDNRRLDKVVAVLYSCEKMMQLQSSKEGYQTLQSKHNIEEGPSWIVMEASLRILEFAVLDQVCQQRLSHESRVSAIIVNLLKTIKSIKTGPLESEWMICAALRLCINLCHGCNIASKQLVGENGHNVVLDWLVKECFAAGLLQDEIARGDGEDIEESFDVRVLCLAVLASTVNQEMNVCNSFHEMQAEGMEKRECGAISFVLEILRTAELEAKKEESKESSEEDEEGDRRRKRTTKEEDAERESRAQFVMERKITIGYVCLLIGALACDSKSNRELIQDVLPGKSFIGVAAVLAEFLEFHHEVGVISGSMNRMYAEIIKKIVEPEAEKEVSAVEVVDDDIGEDWTADAEAQGDDLDLLLNSPDDEDGELGADEEFQRVEEPAETRCGKTTLATPVGGTV